MKTPYTISSKPSSQTRGQEGTWMGRNWFNLILLYVSGHFFFQNQIQFNVRLDEGQIVPYQAGQAFGMAVPTPIKLAVSEIPASNVSQFKKINEAAAQAKIQSAPKKAVQGFSIRNLTPILSPGYAKRKGIPADVVEARVNTCKQYVNQHHGIAEEEMRLYGIPASITLAQGLLESDAGESILARESLNHFGIKCRTRCLGCTCRNYADDVAYDMFRVFENVQESYREHSLLLNSPRYKHLKKLAASDYKGWAKGLKKAGYATDPKYAQKLIQIIEILGLDQYDQKA